MRRAGFRGGHYLNYLMNDLHYLMNRDRHSMNKKNRYWSWAGAMVVAGAMTLILAGCHHKSAEDYLAEGDADMQATKLADAEKAYQEAVKLAPNDPRTHIALGNLYVFEHKPGEAQIE